jgi:hypothetical protein
VLGASRNGACPFFANFCFDIVRSASSVNILRLGWLCNNTIELICRNKFAFTLIPRGKNFSGRSTAENARMDESGKLNVWYMPAGC